MERTRERASVPPRSLDALHVTGQSTETSHPASIPSARARIVGIDVARGIAIIGMMAVHILDPGPFPWIDAMPDDWDEVFAGRSSILFAIIAGISVALMTGHDQPVTGAHLVRARTRILVRAVVIFAIGGILNMLVHNIAVILEYYAVLFVLVLPFLAWPPRRVLQLAVALAILLPPMYIIVINLAIRSELGEPSTTGRLVLYGHYPAIIWVIFILIGLGVGRLELSSGRIQRHLLAIGTAMLIVGYGAGQAAQRLFPPRPLAEDELPGRFDLDRMASMEPHTGTWFEVIGSSGVALAVLALCLMVTPRAGRLLAPLAAAGSMALSIYVVHVVSMVWIWPELTEDTQYPFYLGTVAVSLVFASAWARLFGRGPLERLLTTVSQRTATAKRPAAAQVAS